MKGKNKRPLLTFTTTPEVRAALAEMKEQGISNAEAIRRGVMLLSKKYHAGPPFKK